MNYPAISVEEYIQQLPKERQTVIQQLRTLVANNIPEGFVEELNYGMIGFVVPHDKYPEGYHCDPKLPLPFINIASQKNFIALYHMGIYANEPLHNWFVKEYPKHAKYKLDMGKSCIRFKRMDDIPYGLIEELVKKMSVSDWIELYESTIKN